MAWKLFMGVKVDYVSNQLRSIDKIRGMNITIVILKKNDHATSYVVIRKA